MSGWEHPRVIIFHFSVARRDSLRQPDWALQCKCMYYQLFEVLDLGSENWQSDCNIGHGQAKVCMDVFKRMI